MCHHWVWGIKGFRGSKISGLRISVNRFRVCGSGLQECEGGQGGCGRNVFLVGFYGVKGLGAWSSQNSAVDVDSCNFHRDAQPRAYQTSKS